MGDERSLEFVVIKLTLNIPKTASPELIDLLTKMLAPDPKARISMEEVSVHDWFTKSEKGIVEVPKRYPKIKSYTDIHSVQAKVCDSNYSFVPVKATASSWPGLTKTFHNSHSIVD
jgi:serine/threonine protein kinase